jgi:hypothetical protein
MEKDIGKLKKNDTADIVIRVDDFGGQRGLTIREFVTSERYTGFTKAGVRISAENFPKFKEMINSVSEEEMNEAPEQPEQPADQETLDKKPAEESKEEAPKTDMPDY